MIPLFLKLAFVPHGIKFTSSVTYFIGMGLIGAGAKSI